MTDTKHFDQAAATWDLGERRVALAHGVATAIAARVPLAPGQAMLDFGCGTGLVTLALAPQVGRITGADTSPGMLKTLAEKAEAQGTPVRLLALDPAGAMELEGPYDLIVSSMTLHHVAEVPTLFRLFFQQLHPGGRVALADLDEEDGSFHDADVSIHHTGFPRERIQVWLQEAGFTEIELGTATETQKDGRNYPVFLATARKAP